jgi:DNA-binding transcriptional LysR family regulator
VFDHDFAPTAVPDTLTVDRLFDDPVEILLPATHRLAQSPVINSADLAGDTWIRAHDGSSAELAEHVLARHRLDPPRLLAGHGDEPVEAQALVDAGRGVTLTYDLTVVIDQHNLLSRPLAGERFVRHIAVAYAAGPLAPVVGTVLDAIDTSANTTKSRSLLGRIGWGVAFQEPKHLSVVHPGEGSWG